MRAFTKDVIETICDGIRDGKIEYAGSRTEMRFRPTVSQRLDDALCPITAWHWLKTGEWYNVADYTEIHCDEAGIGEDEERDEIANAADMTLDTMRHDVHVNANYESEVPRFMQLHKDKVVVMRRQVLLRRLYEKLFITA